MYIVLDLSQKLKGYSIFKCFLDSYKKDGNLVFVDNVKSFDEFSYDFVSIKNEIENILFNNHTNIWNLCVIYNNECMENDCLKGSIRALYDNVCDLLINPISDKYSFDSMYIISLDELMRSYDGIPSNSNALGSISIDSLGYLSSNLNCDYEDILFKGNDFEDIQKIYKETVPNDLYLSPSAKNDFLDRFNKIYIDNKIEIIDEKYKDLMWYRNHLIRIKQQFAKHILNDNYIDPSMILKSLLKEEISTSVLPNVYILHYGYNNQKNFYNNNDGYNPFIESYRKKLKIIMILIFISSYNLKKYLKEHNPLLIKRHWSIKINLNDDVLSNMLVSYKDKLSEEKQKIIKNLDVQVEYEEYSPAPFSAEYTMPVLIEPDKPSVSLYFREEEENSVNRFMENIIQRYKDAVSNSNKRYSVMAKDLRIQREAKATGNKITDNLFDANNKAEEQKRIIQELENETSNFKPKEFYKEEKNIIEDYKNTQYNLYLLLKKRMKLSNIFIICLMIFIICFNFIFYFSFSYSSMNKLISIIYSAGISFAIAALYYIVQFIILYIHNKGIKKEIDRVLSKHNKTVNSFYNEDSDSYKMIIKLYELIMRKKYLNVLNKAIKEQGKTYDSLIYHRSELESYKNNAEKLITSLGLENKYYDYSFIDFDRIKAIDYNLSVLENEVYSPFTYLKDTNGSFTFSLNDQVNDSMKNIYMKCVENIEIITDEEYKDE